VPAGAVAGAATAIAGVGGNIDAIRRLLRTTRCTHSS
jgi:phosphoserine phosphatase